MKKISSILLMIMCFVALVGCTAKQAATTVAGGEVTYENGTYRGTFSDGGVMQVGIQLKLDKNIVKEITFRHLEYNGTDYRKEESNKTVIGLRGQYEQLIKSLVGKDIRTNLSDLYKPGNIVKEKTDALTGATLRSGKIISAIRDALNRGVYSY